MTGSRKYIAPYLENKGHFKCLASLSFRNIVFH